MDKQNIQFTIPEAGAEAEGRSEYVDTSHDDSTAFLPLSFDVITGKKKLIAI